MTRVAWLALGCSLWVAAGEVRALADEVKKAEPTPPTASPPPDDLNFDLLPPPIPAQSEQEAKQVRTRRLLLTLHQNIGIALVAAEIGSIVTGQLNYSDKFNGGNSGRYETIHKAFVYPTIGLGALVAGLALFAPVPIDKKTSGFDRMTLHKIGMFTAAAGWAAEIGLGLYAASREGYANQKGWADAHLAIGYVTLAGLLLGTGAITF
jgi:hypothetical protein